MEVVEKRKGREKCNEIIISTKYSFEQRIPCFSLFCICINIADAFRYEMTFVYWPASAGYYLEIKDIQTQNVPDPLEAWKSTLRILSLGYLNNTTSKIAQYHLSACFNIKRNCTSDSEFALLFENVTHVHNTLCSNLSSL